jgi:hypothetical protein
MMLLVRINLSGVYMNEKNVSLTSVKPTTFAFFVGTMGAVLGVIVAIAAWLQGTVAYTAATDSLLQGLLLGLGAGFLALIFLPMIYFAIGWLAGFVQGVVINLALNAMGGLEVGTRASDDSEALPAQRSTQTATRKAEPTFGETIGRRRDDL